MLEEDMRHIQHPTRDQIELTAIMHALSDPVRLEIVGILARHGASMTCGELMCSRPKSSMSHHFKILRASGLVRTEIDGKEHNNSLRLTDLESRFPGLLPAILQTQEAPVTSR